MIGPKRVKLTAREERDAYALATGRDQGTCVRCGSRGPTERDHRQNRNGFNTVVSNLQLLGGPFGCGCHLWKTQHPHEALALGFAVPSYTRPELWPAWRLNDGWVVYFDTPDEDGNWWRNVTQFTADQLMNRTT